MNLEEELHTITVQALEGEEGKNGELASNINGNNSINFNRKKTKRSFVCDIILQRIAIQHSTSSVNKWDV